jgi:hypothetical protein
MPSLNYNLRPSAFRPPTRYSQKEWQTQLPRPHNRYSTRYWQWLQINMSE